jgi:hypothetical protein
MVAIMTISEATLSKAAFRSSTSSVAAMCRDMASKHPMDGNAKANKLVAICLSGNDDRTWQIPEHTALRSSVVKRLRERLQAAKEASHAAKSRIEKAQNH